MFYAKKIIPITLVTLFIIAAVSRFFFLDQSPPGFFVDEALCAAHTVCLKQYGTNCDGVSWPVYSKAWGHGRVGPVYQYTSLAWIHIFGGSIFAFRALSTLLGLVTVILVTLLAKKIVGWPGALGVLVSAMLSPWGFHSTRLAWDPAIAPVMLVSAVFLFFQAQSSRYQSLMTIAAAIFIFLTFHTYSPVGAQAIFLFTLLFLVQSLVYKFKFKTWIILGISVVCLFSSTFFVDTSLVQGRAGEVSIFGQDSRNPTAGQHWSKKIPQFIENTAQHFKLDYLITKGEFNLRHVVTEFGILSWVDTFAILSAFLLLLILVARESTHLKFTAPYVRLFILGLVGYLSAAMAAGLTWDSLPHGLRSVGGWPFLTILAGTCIAFVSRFIVIRTLILVLAIFYLYSFSNYYYKDFSTAATWWFDKDVTDQLETSFNNKDYDSFDKYMKERHYPEQAKRYFDIQYFNKELKK